MAEAISGLRRPRSAAGLALADKGLQVLYGRSRFGVLGLGFRLWV